MPHSSLPSLPGGRPPVPPRHAEPREAEHARGSEDGGAEQDPVAGDGARAGALTGALAGARLTVPLWPHQVRALAAFGADQAAAFRGGERSNPPYPANGTRSTYLVIPPGG